MSPPRQGAVHKVRLLDSEWAWVNEEAERLGVTAPEVVRRAVRRLRQQQETARGLLDFPVYIPQRSPPSGTVVVSRAPRGSREEDEDVARFLNERIFPIEPVVPDPRPPTKKPR